MVVDDGFAAEEERGMSLGEMLADGPAFGVLEEEGEEVSMAVREGEEGT